MTGIINGVVVVVLLCTLINFSTAKQDIGKESNEKNETKQMANFLPDQVQRDDGLISRRQSTVTPFSTFPVLVKHNTSWFQGRRRHHYRHPWRRHWARQADWMNKDKLVQILGKTALSGKGSSEQFSDDRKKNDYREKLRKYALFQARLDNKEVSYQTED